MLEDKNKHSEAHNINLYVCKKKITDYFILFVNVGALFFMAV